MKRWTCYPTAEHECSYLPQQQATLLLLDPAFPVDQVAYTELLKQGFRRNGNHVYRPQCQQCNACISVRLSVNGFVRNRNQRRNWARNHDLMVRRAITGSSDEYFALYKRYLEIRHARSGMDNPDPESYQRFLLSDWMSTVFYEFRMAEKLLAVAVVDELTDGLSAVYIFYDPDQGRRALGRYAILTQIEIARKRGLSWLYLGYWVADCQKMQYKNEYQPLEYFYRNTWHQSPPEGIN